MAPLAPGGRMNLKSAKQVLEQAGFKERPYEEDEVLMVSRSRQVLLIETESGDISASVSPIGPDWYTQFPDRDFEFPSGTPASALLHAVKAAPFVMAYAPALSEKPARGVNR